MLEDPKQPQLVYVGTEVGIWASFDRGASWQDLRLGLPPLAVVDMKVHPCDNDLVMATHARGFYVLDDITPLQAIAGTREVGPRPFTQPTLFTPMPPVRYTPASDTSVLGNRVWVARNQPYGAIINYYLPSAVASVQLAIRDSGGRLVQTLNGPGEAGVNRALWNLSERSSCAGDESGPVAVGGRGRGGGSWRRAVPGEYTVVLTAGEAKTEQTFTVRMDPGIAVSNEDMAAWHREASTIERTECRVARAQADVAELERRASELDTQGRAADAHSLRSRLRPLVLILRGDPRDPGHVNLPGRVNWVTIQVGNYSGRPTAAQSEWIQKYASEADAAMQALSAIRSSVVPPLNGVGSPEGLPDCPATLKGCTTARQP